jgi:hypothetical protein
MAYIRFQSAEPHGDGRRPGVFGLINGLSRAGRLTPEQEEFRRVNNAWYEANFPNPSTSDPSVYDHAANPGAMAWFKDSAHTFLERVEGYLDILCAYGVQCDRLVSHHLPGVIIYEDDHQIVVVPPNASR